MIKNGKESGYNFISVLNREGNNYVLGPTFQQQVREIVRAAQ
ncbi:MAG: hypothetical protein GIKADHBN_01026 [Phycisphaerales bacterium]|nr:hypothetical protein [Phycisphaerales bacterium]